MITSGPRVVKLINCGFLFLVLGKKCYFFDNFGDFCWNKWEMFLVLVDLGTCFWGIFFENVGKEWEMCLEKNGKKCFVEDY